MTVDKNYFPGWVRKSVTFTDDDGNIRLDKKFIDILKPYGITGTFNLPSANLEAYTPEFYREFYRGFGIANHCLLHPMVITEEEKGRISPEVFDPESADGEYIYKTEREGVYRKKTRSGWWSHTAEPEAYIALVGEAQAVLCSVFGEEKIKGFVWPYCEQKSDEVKRYLASAFSSVRKTGTLKDTTAFSMPKDRYAWSYNAEHTCLNEIAEIYENYPDDGELKFFAFGLHSHDYENNKCWDVLERFARRYGNRPEEFYYADVDTIFAYEDAVNALEVKECEVINGSEITLYIKVDGKRVTVAPGSRVDLTKI